MLRERYNLSGNEPLPPGNGPNLSPFEHRGETVEFLELLSLPEDEESSNGGHAHVFKVRIKEETYALKVFKFYDLEEDRSSNFPFHNRRVANTTMTYQSDPFFAECRAYGRIQEIQKKRQAKAKRRKIPNIAVPCFGFLGLPATTYEELFRSKFAITDWNRRDSDYRRPRSKREPFRAIVKKLVDDQKAIVNPSKMLGDLKKLRQGGIYQRDIHVRNYLGGLLVDFSVAWTTPHWSLEVLRDPNLTDQKDQELYDFDRMIKSEGIITTVRATKNEETHRKLRPVLSK